MPVPEALDSTLCFVEDAVRVYECGGGGHSPQGGL